MLDENDIINSVCRYLERRSFAIQQRRLPTQQGDDIVAVRGIRLSLHIEAKGETSTRRDSGRHGLPFNGNQVFDVVAKAFYRAAEMAQRHHDRRLRHYAGLALPYTDAFRRRIAAIEKSLRKCNLLI